MKTVNLQFIVTPAHGYLRVPRDIAELTGIEWSRFSYIDKAGEFVYLEEDCDAPQLEPVLAEYGITVKVDHVGHDIREYYRIKSMRSLGQ